MSDRPLHARARRRLAAILAAGALAGCFSARDFALPADDPGPSTQPHEQRRSARRQPATAKAEPRSDGGLDAAPPESLAIARAFSCGQEATCACDEAGCSEECGEARACGPMVCGPGPCRVACSGASSCPIDCRGATCAAECSGASSCTIDCGEGGTCVDVRCASGSACLLVCEGALGCAFAACEGVETACADGNVVCNRDCP